jgi:hypothetical protein
MCFEMIIEGLTALGTIGAVGVGMIAIRNSDRNSRQQVLVGKLEEIFEIIQALSRKYGIFNELYFKVEDLHDDTHPEIETIDQYYTIRDQLLPEEERKQIIVYLSRIEVLANCYTKGTLQKSILNYENLMYEFSEFIFTTGSIQKDRNWKDGFPKIEPYYDLTEKLKKDIISQMKIVK